MAGVLNTRVGYTGGKQAKPTYYSMGDHTESIKIEYDPSRVSYDALLDVFFAKHDPSVKRKCQYRSAIFYHTDEQKLTAQARIAKLGTSVATALEPASFWTDAEEYHQQYIKKAQDGANFDDDD